MTRPRTGTAGNGALLTALCVLGMAASGCSDQAPEPAAATPGTGTAKRANAPTGDAADMVSAVTLSGADAPVNLHFALRSRPQPDQPLEVGFILQPTRDIDSAQVVFEPNDWIQIASENPFFSIAHTAAGSGAVHKLTVIPKQRGILSLNAVVTVDLPTGPVARSFSIPIIVAADKS